MAGFDLVRSTLFSPRSMVCLLVWNSISWLLSLAGLNCVSAEQTEASEAVSNSKQLAAVVQKAFQQTHDGWSSDEVLLQDELNEAFVLHCRKKLPNAKTVELNWTLLNLRKAGKLKTKSTRRRPANHEAYRHISEIVSRHLHDKWMVTTDRMMCEPKYRREFDRMAKQLAPDIDAYLLRKAAFGLRKARQLKPEWVARVADWGRTISTRSLKEISNEPNNIPDGPGVYLFRDETGYLYIGEAANLRKRLTEHVTESDRKSLAAYLKSASKKTIGGKPDAEKRGIKVEIHAFDRTSQAAKTSMRRAYESELIQSRKPRFNVRP